jgi:hypothetical protein
MNVCDESSQPAERITAIPSPPAMLSQDEIQDWANRVGRDPGFRLVEFEQKEASGVRRAKTHIRFDAYDREYHIWVLPELDLLLLDVFYRQAGIDEQLFKREISAQSLEAIEAKWFSRVRPRPASGSEVREGILDEVFKPEDRLGARRAQ